MHISCYIISIIEQATVLKLKPLINGYAYKGPYTANFANKFKFYFIGEM